MGLQLRVHTACAATFVAALAVALLETLPLALLCPSNHIRSISLRSRGYYDPTPESYVWKLTYNEYYTISPECHSWVVVFLCVICVLEFLFVCEMLFWRDPIAVVLRCDGGMACGSEHFIKPEACSARGGALFAGQGNLQQRARHTNLQREAVSKTGLRVKS